ncbi:MAG: hypothetical protein PGN11_12965 [Quadrisphaera sp.]
MRLFVALIQHSVQEGQHHTHREEDDVRDGARPQAPVLALRRVVWP